MRISDWSSDVCSSDLILSSPIASSLPLRQCALMNAIPPRHDGPLAARDRVSRGHDVLSRLFAKAFHKVLDRIDTGLRSEEHTSELQSLMRTSYAVFCLKKKTKNNITKPQENMHT